MRKTSNWLLAFGLGMFLAACSAPVANIAPEGQLSVLDAGTLDTSLKKLESNWIFKGEDFDDLTEGKNPSLKLTSTQSAKALSIRPTSPTDFLLIRQTYATLVASPFLSWTWKKEKGVPDFQVVVGFKGGVENNSLLNLQMPRFGADIPKFDRSITIGHLWELRNEAVHSSSKDRAFVSIGILPYLSGSWKRETIDLLKLYTKIWPADKASSLQVVFIGLSVTPKKEDTPTLVRNITLSR